MKPASQTPPKISPELKTKLDAFVAVLEKRAAAKRDAKSSFEYVTAVREKLIILKAKYRKGGKNGSAAAIAYIIEKTDAIALKFAPQENEEDSLVKDLKESY